MLRRNIRALYKDWWGQQHKVVVQLHLNVVFLFEFLQQILIFVHKKVIFETSYIQKNPHYTRDITLKRVTSSGIHLRGSAPGQHSSEETLQQWRAVGNTASDISGLVFVPKTYRADNNVFNYEHVKLSLVLEPGPDVLFSGGPDE